MNFEVGEKRASERGRLRARGARGSARVRGAGALGSPLQTRGQPRQVEPRAGGTEQWPGAGAEGDSYAPDLRQESPPRNFAWDVFFSLLVLNLPAPGRLHLFPPSPPHNLPLPRSLPTLRGCLISPEEWEVAGSRTRLKWLGGWVRHGMSSQWLNFSGRKGQFPPPKPERGALSLISPLPFFGFPWAGGQAGRLGKVSAPLPPARGGNRGAAPAPRSEAHSPARASRLGVQPGNRARPPAWEPSATGVVSAPLGPALRDKEPAGGRGAEAAARAPAPHVKRNNLFILGFKKPSLLPVLRGRRPLLPAWSARSGPVPPAAPPSSSSSSFPAPPARPPPPFWNAAVGEGAGGALSASRPGSAPGPPGWEGRGARDPAPPPLPAAAWRDNPGPGAREGRIALCKQEAETGASL